jgi:hypothetical protein
MDVVMNWPLAAVLIVLIICAAVVAVGWLGQKR